MLVCFRCKATTRCTLTFHGIHTSSKEPRLSSPTCRSVVSIVYAGCRPAIPTLNLSRCNLTNGSQTGVNGKRNQLIGFYVRGGRMEVGTAAMFLSIK